jgi:hypothetical protein
MAHCVQLSISSYQHILPFSGSPLFTVLPPSALTYRRIQLEPLYTGYLVVGY